MGLDEFMDSSSGGGGGQTKQTNQESDNEKDISEAFKVVGSGRRKKVFQNEEDWLETVEFIENKMNMRINEVMRLDPENRHQVLHRAILAKDKEESNDFYMKRKCIVCNGDFIFPHNWDFEEYKGEIVCPDHTVREVKEAFEKINRDTDIQLGRVG